MRKGGNSGLLIGLAAAGAAAYYYFKQQGGQLGQNLSFGVKKVSFDKATTEKNIYLRIYFTVVATLKNSSKLGGRIESGNLELFFQDKQLTSAKLNKPIIVEAGQSIDVPILLSIPTLSIFSTVTSAAAYFLANKKINLVLRGTLDTSAGTVNINEKIAL